MKRIITLLFGFVLVFAGTGCNASKVNELSKGRQGNPVTVAHEKSKDVITAEFAAEIFEKSIKEYKNTIISPLSVLCALSMTANGARGNTLEQMEQVLGMSCDEWNQAMYTYRNQFLGDKTCKMTMANSIWFTDHLSFAVNEEFLQTNADYYGAEIFQAPFDTSTVSNINQWVNKNTDGRIKSIIDEIPPSAVMYLLNALTFDGEWEKIYEKG